MLFLLVKLLGTTGEEESGSDNQEQGDIDSTGEVENREAKKYNRRRHARANVLRYGERKDDEGVCQGIT